DALGVRILAGQGAPLEEAERAARRARQRGDTEALASPFQRANGDRTYILHPRHEPVRRSSRHCAYVGPKSHRSASPCATSTANSHRTNATRRSGGSGSLLERFSSGPALPRI